MYQKHPYCTPELQIDVCPDRDLIVTSFSVQDAGDGDTVYLGL